MEVTINPNTVLDQNNTEYIYFSGTSYLGAATHPEFISRMQKSMQQWGTSYGSSREANITLSAYRKAEIFLKHFLGLEDLVTVSSGTLSGLLTLHVLENEENAFFHLPKTHPAITHPKSFDLFINNEVHPLACSSIKQNIVILCDAMPSLEIEPVSFSFLDKISETKNIILVIDESHSLGVLGKQGSGIANSIPKKENLNLIVVSSLTKAYGLPGGIIAGSTSFINKIKALDLFKGSAGMSPAALDCFLNAQSFYKDQRSKLQKHCEYVYHALHTIQAIRIDKNYPVFFFDDENIADYLLSKDIIITSFYYPTIGKKLNRIVLNANHTKEQLDILIHSLRQYEAL